jgi:hypothetical protein
LEDQQYLILDTPRGQAYVQFAGLGKVGMRAETVSNQYLAPRQKLDRRQYMRLLELGWHPPTRLPPKLESKRQRGGSPNFYMDCPRPVRWRTVARLALATLRQVHGIASPAKLRYDAFVHDGLERQLLAATQLVVGGHHRHGAGVLDALLQRLG